MQLRFPHLTGRNEITDERCLVQGLVYGKHPIRILLLIRLTHAVRETYEAIIGGGPVTSTLGFWRHFLEELNLREWL